MKKILFLLHLPPPIHGASMVSQYIKDSNIINKAFYCRYVNIGISESIDDIGKSNPIKIFRYLNILLKIFINLIKFNPNLCYFTITAKGIAFYKDALIVIILKIFRVKLVIHFHNKGVRSRQNKWFDDKLYRMVFKNSNVILLSKHLFVDIEKYVSQDRVHYCPNGIPSNNKTILKKSNEKNIGKIEILFLSNLIESKGVYILLEACKILQKKQLPFHCTFIGGVGDITAKEFYQKIINLGLTTEVNYVGSKYGSDKEKAFLQADIFALPTYYNNECFPLVILEAMQNALPVISTFEGGIPDIIEDKVTGFLVPQKNAIVLAEKLEYIITNYELMLQMGKAGKAKLENEFTLPIFEENLKTIFNFIFSENH
jgi:glycosyltransferase involved in cell wall biosynthesis